MANRLLSYALRRRSLASLVTHFSAPALPFRSISASPLDQIAFSSQNKYWGIRCLCHGAVRLVLSDGKPKFETREIEPPKKEKWRTKKQLKLKRKKEKRKRKEANKRDPRCLRAKGKKKKQKFQNAEERIKYKIEQAKIKEALLLERLKRYEVLPIQGPSPEPENLTGEERFFIKKMAQKRSNYAPIGRRGIYGGCIQNMHLHWKKHETVEVVFNKACKRGQFEEFEKEIGRLSGGIPIERKKNSIVFYRGKNYVQPKEMLPVGTLSKKRALEKSKYEQSLESVRRFIAISEKELELYYRHVALYGDPNNRTSKPLIGEPSKGSDSCSETDRGDESVHSSSESISTDCSGSELDSEDSNFVYSPVSYSNTDKVWENLT